MYRSGVFVPTPSIHCFLLAQCGMATIAMLMICRGNNVRGAQCEMQEAISCIQFCYNGVESMTPNVYLSCV